MREHIGLFRGKRIENGEWIEGYFEPEVNWGGHHFGVTISYVGEHGWLEDFEVDPDSIGECTGLKDKNGKLIFEGDIVKETFEGTSTEYEGDFSEYRYDYDFEGYKIGKVTFGGYGAFVTSSCGELWIDGEKADYTPTRRKRLAAYRCEVIGNVTDNPELLKGGEGE